MDGQLKTMRDQLDEMKSNTGQTDKIIAQATTSANAAIKASEIAS